MSLSSPPRLPNVFVTGTPGTGKTTLCERMSEACDLKHINVSDYIKQHQLYTEWDPLYQCYVIDDENVLVDALDEQLRHGGHVIDFHTASFFPVRWFQLVIVLRSSTEVLWERLQARGYVQDKIDENMEAEIMQVCLDEAKEGWGERVVELSSDSAQDLESNLNRFQQWLSQWQLDNPIDTIT